MRLLKLLTFLALSSTFYNSAYAAGPTFECDGTPYPTIGSNPTTIQQMDKQTLAVSTLATLTPSSTINATGFNILDNYIYGLNSLNFMQLASDGTYTMLGQPTGIGASAGVTWGIKVTYAGTMDSSGYWYGHDSNYVYRVYIGSNPSAGSLTFERFARSGSFTKNLADLAFNPLDGSLYGMNGSSLRKLTIAGVGSTVSTSGSLSGNAGGAWSTSSGTLYFYNNGSGLLYSVDMTSTTPEANFVGNVAQNGTFDATACTPPVLLKSVGNEEVEPGDSVTFNFKMSNPLSTPITVEFTDILEPGLSFVSGSISPAAPGSGTITTFTDNKLVISNLVIPSGLPPNNEVNFTAEVLIDPNISTSTTITNQAEITYGVNTTLSDNPGGSIDDPTAITVIMSDWGDAPSSYGDVKHLLSNANLFMGTAPDAEKQQQNTANGFIDGTGDDSDNAADEDAVTFPVLAEGTMANISVDVNQSSANEGFLQGWVDWNGDGDFADENERVATDLQSNTAGNSVITASVSVPTTTTLTQTFARFRWSTSSGLDSATIAPDGEVEDYAITIKPADRGDAPSSMASIDASLTAPYGEAIHAIDNAVYLGNLIDADPDSQNTSLLADGDDIDGSDDDDGVSFPLIGPTPVLRVGTSNIVTIEASAAGYLNAWIDYNQDGDWDDAGETIATNNPLATGTNFLTLTPTGTSPHGATYARFRFTSTLVTNPSPIGILADGEVEDYRINLLMAAPDPADLCSSVIQNTGFETAPHPTTFLLKAEDEVEGWATIADSPSSGSSFAQRNVIEVWKSGFGGVTAFEGDYFAELNANLPGMLYQDVELIPGSSYTWSFSHRGRSGTDTITVLMGPPDAVVSQGDFSTGNTAWKAYHGVYVVPVGQYITRFAFQATSPSSYGNFVDAIKIPGGCDFGDAPNSYGTQSDNNGSYHVSNALLYLGSDPGDSEEDGQPSVTADGDDNTGISDEDSVSILESLSDVDRSYSVDVVTTNNTGNTAKLISWIDFDGNGTFDADEAATRNVPTGITGTSITLNWFNLPVDIQAGDSYMRIRLTTEPITSTETGGSKWDGEIEDYPLTISSRAIISGRVYIDTNSNAVIDTDETGIAGTVIVLRDFFSGVCRSTTTNGNGDYHFSEVFAGSYELYQAHGESTTVPQSCGVTSVNNPTGYQSTTPDTLTITVSDDDITDQNFGEAPIQGITFEPDHQSEVLAGEVKLYTHTFSTEADGSVSFTSSGTGNIAPDWSSTLYNDNNCDGTLSDIEVSSTINGISLTISAGNQLCIINKVSAPPNAPIQDSFTAKITADFIYAGGNTADLRLQVIDLTIVGQSQTSTGQSGLKLTKTVENLTQATAETETANQAIAGDVIKYRIYYQNTGTEAIFEVNIKDTVPAFTRLISGSMSCDVTPPTLACSSNINTDSLDWALAGTLAAGVSGHVSYEVTIDN